MINFVFTLYNYCFSETWQNFFFYLQCSTSKKESVLFIFWFIRHNFHNTATVYWFTWPNSTVTVKSVSLYYLTLIFMSFWQISMCFTLCYPISCQFRHKISSCRIRQVLLYRIIYTDLALIRLQDGYNVMTDDLPRGQLTDPDLDQQLLDLGVDLTVRWGHQEGVDRVQIPLEHSQRVCKANHIIKCLDVRASQST